MIVDMHCHYPMHLLARDPENPAVEHLSRARKTRPRWVDKLRAIVLALAARVLNYRKYSDKWRVDLGGLEKGDVRVAFSVLYQPFAEIDLDELPGWPGGPPEDGYFRDLVTQLEEVERDLETLDGRFARHFVVKSAQDLEEARKGERVAFVHCVEGGFHLGPDPGQVEPHVKELADHGVAYITLAHLFWRQVATNSPALPFLPDWLYNVIFHQPKDAGLTPIGEAAVRAMHRHGVLVDVSHMRADALAETFGLLRDLDRDGRRDPRDFPVIASHSGFRCGRQAYNVDKDTVEEVARRGGVIGLILAQHQLNDGVRRRDTKDVPASMKVIFRHIDAIYGVTGNYDNIAIGSDLDGFIKPTMGGFEYAADLAKLREPLEHQYPGQADRILSGNALRVLEKAFAGRPAV